MHRMCWIVPLAAIAGGSCHPSPPPQGSASAAPSGGSPEASSNAALASATPAANVRGLRLIDGTAGKTLQLSAHYPMGRKERFKGTLVIDDVYTQVTWPERPPAQYRVDRHRHLLYDGYSESRLYVWDTRSQQLTDLGRMQLVHLDGKLLIVDAHRPMQLHADKAELVPLYQPPEHHLLSVGGLHRGRLLLIYRPHRVMGGKASGNAPARLVWLQGDAPPREVSMDLRGFGVAESNGVRGDRLLLVGSLSASRATAGNMNAFGWDRPFKVGLAVLDLSKLVIRELGTATGGWTQYTAMPHPYVRARWSPKSGQQPTPLTGLAECINLVHPDTEAITHSGCARDATHP